MTPRIKEASCPICGQVRRVTKDGRMAVHARYTARYRHTVPCEGSGVEYNDAYLHSRFDSASLARKCKERVANALEDIDQARKELALAEADLPRLRLSAEEAASALDAWDAANPRPR